jgi:peptidoglycan/LPS O-acetylase OafA/YrhL
MESRRNFGLDILRSAAILMVIASHLLLAFHNVGIYGVELFFVLSGFLIGGILIRSVNRSGIFTFGDLKTFWIRRWFRTLPNYYWFLLLYLLLYLLVIGTGATSLQLASYGVFMQNFAWSIYPFATHTWSLTIEEWFYLSFPLAFYFYARGATGRDDLLRKFLRTVLFFLVFPALLRFAEPLWLGYSDARTVVVCRLDALMYGVLFAWLKTNQRHWRTAGKLWPLGIIGLTASVLFIRDSAHWSQAIAFTLIPQSFALILPVFNRLHSATGPLAAAIQRISIWSYSIYLCHMLVYTVAMRLTHYENLSPLGQIAVKCLSLAGIFAISALNYHFFEHPATNLRDRLDKQSEAEPEPVILLT